MSSEEWSNIREKLSHGNRSAFDHLYNSLWSKMYATAFNYVRDKEISKEIVQEVFVRLWLKRSELSRINDITKFAMRTLQFKVYDHFDRQAIEKRYRMHAMTSTPSQVNNTHHQVEYDETLDRLNTELEKLPETTKTVFRLSRFNHFSNEEIAANLKLSVKAVEYHITQSLKHLRLRLSDLFILTLASWNFLHPF
jgi:RNA polymerase sigma-70 factor (family 1)